MSSWLSCIFEAFASKIQESHEDVCLYWLYLWGASKKSAI